MDVNRITIKGRLGGDPKIDEAGQMSLNIATGEEWTDRKSGEQRKSTTWVLVKSKATMFNPVTMDALRKGAPVYVQGALRTWFEPETGKGGAYVVCWPWVRDHMLSVDTRWVPRSVSDGDDVDDSLAAVASKSSSEDDMPF